MNRLYENKAQMNSISMHLGESVGMIICSTDFSLGFLLTFFSTIGQSVGINYKNRIFVFSRVKLFHFGPVSFSSLIVSAFQKSLSSLSGVDDI